MKTMIDFENYCTAEQIEIAYRLGAPIDRKIGAGVSEIFDIDDFIIPTTSQMINWMRETFNIQPFVNTVLMHASVHIIDKMDLIVVKGKDNFPITFGSYKEAELAAIDAALDYLENNN